MGEHCRVYRRRWVMLCLFALCSCANATHWIQYSIIANVCMYYYDVSALYINWTSMIYMAVYIPLVFPASWILERQGLRVSVILGAAMMCVGAWIKVWTAQPDQFALTFLGQLIVGVAQMFTLGVPARLAAIWFPQHQVSTACAIGVFGNQLGIAIGFLVPPAVVDDVKDKEVIGEQLHMLYFGMALAASIVLLLLVLLFEARPPLPPSMAQLIALKKAGEGEGGHYLSSIRQLLQNRDFSLLLVSFGLNIGVFYAYSTLLNQELVSFPEGFQHAGRVGLTLVVGGVIGSVVWGVVLDKTHMYKETTLGIYIMAVVGMLGYTFALYSQHLVLVYATSAFLGFFMNGYLTVGYEFGAELTFPHAETTTSGLLNAVGELCGMASVLGAGAMLEPYGSTFTNLALTVILAMGLVLSMPISKTKLRRLAASKVRPEENHLHIFQE
ncbi:feline leukemia virus subgroup C receptor-related protein 2-like isoform X2 [Homalodisca vitripennis]|nr:feline leukemia virus subgroup C receptor-related protein 2-like isoform X2 [Homalodisca vitripennis]XP_046662120.1 feline leukemia virus subgroup C receptor-related protein 2-like isoform X2 [Homalodisca vitripennis]